MLLCCCDDLMPRSRMQLFMNVFVLRPKNATLQTFEGIMTLYIRGMFFNSCHLLDYFSRVLTARKLFVCGESPILSDQIGIKIVAL